MFTLIFNLYSFFRKSTLFPETLMLFICKIFIVFKVINLNELINTYLKRKSNIVKCSFSSALLFPYEASIFDISFLSIVLLLLGISLWKSLKTKKHSLLPSAILIIIASFISLYYSPQISVVSFVIFLSVFLVVVFTTYIYVFHYRQLSYSIDPSASAKMSVLDYLKFYFIIYHPVILFIINIVVIISCYFLFSGSFNVELIQDDTIVIVKPDEKIVMVKPDEIKDSLQNKDNAFSWKLIYQIPFTLLKIYFIMEVINQIIHLIWAFAAPGNFELLAPNIPTPVPPMIEGPRVELFENTILHPSFIGPELYTQDEIWSLTMKLEQDIYVHSEQLFKQNDQTLVFRYRDVVIDYLHSHPSRDILFSRNFNDLQNTNYVINQLIQNCIINFALTSNHIYYDMGFGLFIEQLALLNGDNPVNYCYDPVLYAKLQAEFVLHFKM